MSVEMTIDCPEKGKCRFASGCMVLKPGDERRRFTPTLKIRMVDLKLTVRCFSFKEKVYEGKTRVFLDED